MSTAGLLLSLALLAVGCAHAEEPTCWVEYQRDAAACSKEQLRCQMDVDGNADQQRCNEQVEACWAELGAALHRCAGRRSCAGTWWRCMDACDAHHCLDECWDPFYECADWYATDCEDACLGGVSRCLDLSAGVTDADLTGQIACWQTYFLDCIPACYPDA